MSTRRTGNLLVSTAQLRTWLRLCSRVEVITGSHRRRLRSAKTRTRGAFEEVEAVSAGITQMDDGYWRCSAVEKRSPWSNGYPIFDWKRRSSRCFYHQRTLLRHLLIDVCISVGGLAVVVAVPSSRSNDGLDKADGIGPVAPRR
jgi:hypothetical protein